MPPALQASPRPAHRPLLRAIWTKVETGSWAAALALSTVLASFTPTWADAPAATASKAAELEVIDLFNNKDGKYDVYRIPALLATPKGTVLAFAEARRGPGGDWSEIDLVMRRSTDGGKTWEPTRVFEGGDRHADIRNEMNRNKSPSLTLNNIVPILDKKTGRIHLLYCVEYARCFYTYSDDEGKTFAEPVDITGAFEKFRTRDGYDWKVLATGPAHGIQLKSGRLVVPVWLSTGTGGGAHRPSCVSTIYSDDAGQTWHAGDMVCNNPDPKNPSETIAVELVDGRVMLNIRHENPEHRRAVSTSPDGATGWTPIAFDEALYEPVCMASILRLSDQSTGGKNRILFANPDVSSIPADKRSKGGRQNLTFKLSEDEGQTWPIRKVLDPDAAGYSDLALNPDGTILCLWENGTKGSPGALSLARFSLEWLTGGQESLASPHAAPAGK